MDIDPDSDNGEDAGAIEIDLDDYAGNQGDEEDSDDSTSLPSRLGKRRRDPAAPKPSNLHPDDPANFLKLCTALKILVARQVTTDQIETAQKLLESYCKELVSVSACTSFSSLSFTCAFQLYGPSIIRPNHHYSIHVPDCVRDYGPLHEFWTFLFERMNKVLKSYKTSNHGGGELEASFFREFQRTSCEARLVSSHHQVLNYIMILSVVAFTGRPAKPRWRSAVSCRSHAACLSR